MLERDQRARFARALDLLDGYILEHGSKSGSRNALESALRGEGDNYEEERAVDLITGLLQVGQMLVTLRQIELADKPGPAATISHLRKAFATPNE